MLRSITKFCVLLLLVAGFPGSAHAYRIQNCDDVAEADIEKAADWIEANMVTLVDQFTFLTERQRQEIVRKWARLDLRCSDSEAQCSRFLGHAHGGPGSQVNLCIYTLTSSQSLCDLVGTIMHEQGHAHGFRMVPGHNNPTQYHRDTDPIYRMGNIAQDACEADTAFVDAPLQAAGERSIGAPAARTSNAGPAAARRTCACATKTATVRSGSPASSPPPPATTARALPVRSVLPARGTTNAAPISASRTPAYAATTATARQARSAERRSPGRTDAKRRPTVASFRCKRCAPGMPSAARTSASPTSACATATAIARLGRSATGRWGRRTRAAWSG